MDKLPKRIDPCPIVESVVEVRFSSVLPGEAIYGVLYSKIGNMFESSNNLPILQVPEALRSADPNLMYQPHYVLAKGDLSLRVGPRSLLFANNGMYKGWEEFSAFIKTALEEIRDTKIVHVPERIGIRYLNFFDFPILDKINFAVSHLGRTITDENTVVRIEFRRERFMEILNVANKSGLTLNNRVVTGSLIDIDCIFGYGPGSTAFYDSYESVLEEGHLLEKTSFFDLLLPDFLATLNPVY